MLKKLSDQKGTSLRKKVQNKRPDEKLHVSYRSKDVDQLRQICGLVPLQTLIRKCLKCNHEFDSEGVHHRMCNYCSKVTSRVSLDKGVYLDD